MNADNFHLVGMATALGIGLMVGIERERRRPDAETPLTAGVRTFTLTALLGALAAALGADALTAAALVVGLLTLAAYWRSSARDAGMTTEIALVTTFMLGALALRDAALAAGIGVVVTGVLAARSYLHQFVQRVVTQQELHDALILAAAALVVLPLTPDHPIDPFGVLNPRKLWKLAVLVMAINALGYVASRLFGARLGLPFAGLASGFVSSTATIGAMGLRAREHPQQSAGAVAGAILSSVATVLYLGMIVASIDSTALLALGPSLLLSGLTATIYALIYTRLALRLPAAAQLSPAGRAFDLRFALLFSLTMAAILLVSALLSRQFGAAGVMAAAAISGLIDAHAAAASAATLGAQGVIATELTVLPILLAFSTNALSKAVVALTAGDRRYAQQVIPGVVMMVAAAWLGLLL